MNGKNKRLIDARHVCWHLESLATPASRYAITSIHTNSLWTLMARKRSLTRAFQQNRKQTRPSCRLYPIHLQLARNVSYLWRSDMLHFPPRVETAVSDYKASNDTFRIEMNHWWCESFDSCTRRLHFFGGIRYVFIVNYFHSIRVKLAQSTSALEVGVFKIKAGSNSTPLLFWWLGL